MKKKLIRDALLYGITSKTWKIMRLSAFFMFLFLSQVWAGTGYSQQTKLSLKMNDARIIEVLDNIEENSEFYFLFNQKLVDVDRKVDVDIQQKTISEILDQLFEGTNVNYLVKDRQIILTTEKTESESVQKKESVKGKVIDENGDSLPGVTVLIKGTTNGTVTNFDGEYTLTNVTEGTTLQFSFVGMKSQEIVVSNQTVIDITLVADAIGIEEVVAVGYGTQRKRDVSGAISSIKTEDVKAGNITNAAELIKGRASGVLVRQNSSEPGGGISIRIRGTSSVSSNNEPLYVIDGFPTDLGNQINPADVESIEILKDAAATAIYGARGANGVVLITTKHGKKGVFNVDYTYNHSIKNLYNPYDLKNAQDIMQFNIQQAKENGTYETNPPYTEDQLKFTGNGTDWIKLATRAAATKNHQLSIAGGEEKLRMAINSGFLEDEGILENTSYDRFTSRINLDYKLNDWVDFGSNIYMARSNRNYQNMGTRSTVDNIMYNLLLMSPMSLPEGSDVFGNPGRVPQVLKQLYEPKIEDIANNFYSSIFGEVDVLKCLTARVQYTYSNNNSKEQQYYPKTTNTGKSVDGLAIINNHKSDKHQFDALLTFQKKFDEIHHVKVLAGTTYSEYIGESNGINGSGFSSDEFSFNNIGAAQKINNVYSNKWKTSKNSFFLRAEYLLNDKYVINASLRADGASNFGEGNKWGYFPAVSAAWQIGEEDWMEFTRPLFSSIKLRASYGITGNDGIGTYLSMAKFGTGNSYLGGSGVQKGMYMVNPANKDLKWEQTAQLNVGVDFSLLKSRIQVNFDYYNKTTTDLLNPIAISTTTSGFATMMGNNGEIENKGFELFIKTNNISHQDFSWSTSLNLSRNKNEVVKLNNGEARYSGMSPQGWYNIEEYSILKEGFPLSTIYGYQFDGIIQTGEEHPTQPKSVPGDPKFVDTNKDGIISAADRTVIGDGNPDLVIGLGNDFNYRNFDFSFFFDANVGHELFNVTKMVLEDANRTQNTIDRWTLKHPSNSIPRNGYQKNHGVQYGNYVNSRFVEDASFFRLSNVELGYRLPLQKIGMNKYIKNLRLAVGAQNLFTLTQYSGFNPEVSTNGDSAVAQGLDYSSYPAYKIFHASVKLTF
uniref:SusC/RagA family TonB-linked outer membrane protein n=1 Tax=uncultured Draconibacterium sp. TaxID=1573823 RepID=UPI0032178F2E